MTIRMLAVALAVAGAAVGLAPLATAAAPYKNCSQAKANGDYNIPESSDKYGPWLDRDGDGIGCEG